MSLMQTAGHKMAALKVMFLQLSNISLTNRMRNWAKNPAEYIFYYTYIYIYIFPLDGAHDASLVQIPFNLNWNTPMPDTSTICRLANTRIYTGTLPKHRKGKQDLSEQVDIQGVMVYTFPVHTALGSLIGWDEEH